MSTTVQISDGAASTQEQATAYPQSRRLSDTQRADIKRLLRRGTPHKEIARLVGCCLGTVVKLARRYGIKRGHERLDVATLERAERLLRDGVSRHETAKKVGCSYATARNLAVRLGLHSGYRKLGEAQKAEAQRLLRQGVPVPEIARLVGCSKSHLQKMAEGLGISLDKRKSEAKRDEVARLLREGRKIKEIETSSGCSASTITKIGKRLGIGRKQRITEAKKAEVVARLERGEYRAKIAKALGCRLLQVDQIARELGIKRNGQRRIVGGRVRDTVAPSNRTRKWRAQSAYYQGPDGLTLLVPTPKMLDFRDTSRQGASDQRPTLKARMQSVRPGDKNYASDPAFVFQWLCQYEHLVWFQPWLCESADSPEKVMVATRAQINACDSAWSYTDHYRAAGVKPGTYQRWVWDVFPRDQLWDFLFWLYGADREPKGWLIVPQRIGDLRHRLTPFGICDAIGLSRMAARNWAADKDKREAVELALDAARRGQKPIADRWRTFVNQNSGTAKGREMIQNMLRFAQAATLKHALENEETGIGWSKAGWRGFLQDVRRGLGQEMEKLLLEFVGIGRLQHAAPYSDARGMAAVPGLFAPSAEMLLFREVAKKRAHEVHLSSIRAAIPPYLFKAWMLDWTVPRKTFDVDGERERLIQTALEEREPAKAGRSAVPTQVAEAIALPAAPSGQVSQPTNRAELANGSGQASGVDSGNLERLRETLPPFAPDSGHWVLNTKAARLLFLETSTLKKYRLLGQKTSDGRFGRDVCGQIWIRPGDHSGAHPWYLRESLRDQSRGEKGNRG